jgi:hypothetical protein
MDVTMQAKVSAISSFLPAEIKKNRSDVSVGLA